MKLGKQITMPETLSKFFNEMLYLQILWAQLRAIQWGLKKFPFASVIAFCHTSFTRFEFESLSYRPSLPRMMKSCYEFNLKYLISGSEIITLGFPFNFLSFAWASPIARETLSLPGMTLWGPQISPPASIISKAFGLLWLTCFEKSA